jgi:hypothetical protein
MPFTETEESLMCSQQPAVEPHPEPDESTLRSHLCFSNINFNIILPCTPRAQNLYVLPKTSLCVRHTSSRQPYGMEIPVCPTEPPVWGFWLPTYTDNRI